METVNNCYCIEYNYTLFDRTNKRTVKGNATAILLNLAKSKIRKGVKEIIAKNINQHWDIAEWGAVDREHCEILTSVQIVHVLEFPESEAQEWIDNMESGIYFQSMNY